MEERIVTLLIVDDEEYIRKVVGMLLEPTYQNILYAANGVEALEQLNLHPEITLVLSDINMPKMDGIAFIKNARERGIKLPFIFFTGFGSESLMLKALEYGAFDFIDKPQFERLEIIIEHAVQTTQSATQKKCSVVTEFQKLVDAKK